jgi:hypothetical protein
MPVCINCRLRFERLAAHYARNPLCQQARLREQSQRQVSSRARTDRSLDSKILERKASTNLQVFHLYLSNACKD